MRYRTLFLLLLVFTTAIGNLLAEKIGLLIVATGKYDQFVDPLITSARKYFCPTHDVTYFVFADGNRITDANDVVRVYEKKMGWPYDTLMRNFIYNKNRDLLSEQDYLFAIDADMLFVEYSRR